MAHRTLIVARLDPAHEEQVAEQFARSDSSDLPHLVGVSRRTLFGYQGLYFHLIEAEQDIRPGLAQVRNHPLFQEVNRGLEPFVKPYDPSWREPADAMARTFYSWSA